MKNQLFEYLLRLGDNSLIIGQRLGEWCGHGPVLEEDIALTNIALDFIGQTTQFLDYAGEIEGKGRNADDLAYKRDVLEFRNVLLCEQPNGDFAETNTRQFFLSAYLDLLYEALKSSKDERLAAIAAKSSKELGYHYRHSRDWMIRLGDGTEESHERIQRAVDRLWTFTGELFEDDEVEKMLNENGIVVLNSSLKSAWDERIQDTLEEATLTLPEEQWMQTGGRTGKHSEHLGFILSDLQFLQRAYPGNEW